MGSHRDMTPTTEVIVCTYNGAAFIVDQLQSIVAQTTRVNKISIYDDRSSDDTVTRIHGFLDRLPSDERGLFTVHVNAGNLGYALNFMNAIAKATEDIVFLCDQDDTWEPRKVEVFLDLFREYAPDMVFSDGSITDEAGQEFRGVNVLASYGLHKRGIRRFRDRAFDLLLKQNYINGAAAAVRRVTAQEAFPLPCDMPHDYWLAIWCSLHAGIVATSQTLYRYRQHRRNVIGMGSTNPLYAWLGIWRQPSAPRERELRIWEAVTERIAGFASSAQLKAARRKLSWLQRVVPRSKTRLTRGIAILKSALDGSYRRYSSTDAALRDVVSLIR